MNKLEQLFQIKKNDLLTIYFTAGYPKRDDTAQIIRTLSERKVDIIEVGIPYSDPLADGPTIQRTGELALAGGMNLDLLFNQLKEVKDLQTPLILMGYYNPFLQYGSEKFLDRCKELEVSGLILPDLPLEVYRRKYKSLFQSRDIRISFLISPQTSEERMKELAGESSGFLYMVSSASTTGAKTGISDEQKAYFERVEKLNLKGIRQIGFGISDRKSYETACQYANGAIIGSAFLNSLKGENLEKEIIDFISSIR